jgi:thiosulfate/3-mercaptopyruvate sulfurtransferase
MTAAATGRRHRVLVDGDWLERRLDDPRVVVLEVDERRDAYDEGHVPGAHRIDRARDLVDPLRRDLVDHRQLGSLLGSCAVTPDSTIVVTGDAHGWWAAYAYWVLRLFGLADLRLLDGGRELWIDQGRPTNRDEPVRIPGEALELPERDDRTHRIFRGELARFVERARGPLVDVRSPAEYAGIVTHMPGHPSEGALRAGHIPGAVNVPWRAAIDEDGRLRGDDELRSTYAAAGATGSEPVVTYCRIGERSSHTWFVLSEVLGLPDVRNYDGSWTEWGNLVGAPIEVGGA